MYDKKRVKVYFKNGFSCEGKVLLWEIEPQDEKHQREHPNGFGMLQSLQGQDVLHIYDLKKEVLMVRVFLEEGQEEQHVPQPKSEVKKPVSAQPVDYKQEVQQEAQQVSQKEHKPVSKQPTRQVPTQQELRMQKLQRLHELREKEKQAEKEAVSRKMKDVTLGGQRTKYDNPSFTKPVASNHTGQEGSEGIPENS